MNPKLDISEVRRIHIDCETEERGPILSMTISPFGAGSAEAIYEDISQGVLFDVTGWVKRNSYPYSNTGYVVPTIRGWSWYRVSWYRATPMRG